MPRKTKSKTEGKTRSKSKAKSRVQMPAVVWRMALAIVKSRLEWHEKQTGEARGPTAQDWSLGFGKAIQNAREKGLVTKTGIRLTKAGEAAEKIKLLQPDATEKRKEYARLLGRRRLETLLKQSSELAGKVKGHKRQASLDELLKESADIYMSVGKSTEAAVQKIRKKASRKS